MKTSSPIAYLGMIALTAALLSLLYAGAFYYQLGALVSAEYWMYETQIVKRDLLEQNRRKRKILLTAGSSALFGIDSSRIEAAFGISTLNMGLHLGRPAEYILSEIEPYMKPGDIVILPLEYEQYSSTTAYNSWFTDQIMAWNPGYFRQLDLKEKLRFMFSIRPQRILVGVMTQLLGEQLESVRQRQLKSPEQILSRVHTAWAQKNYRPDGMYLFLNSDSHGDAIFRSPEPQAQPGGDPYVLGLSFKESPYFWQVLQAFSVRCRTRGIDLYVAWPPVMEGLIDFKDSRVSHSVNVITTRLQEMGISMLGMPSDFQYARERFTGNMYHLTTQGRTEHTTRLLGHMMSAMRSLPRPEEYKIVTAGQPSAGP